jgi:hypothetical protein
MNGDTAGPSQERDSNENERDKPKNGPHPGGRARERRELADRQDWKDWSEFRERT